MEFNDYQAPYETLAHHDEATGKKARRRLWNVFWLLLAVTIVEVLIGLYAQEMLGPLMLKIIFIGLTVVKAAYIVMVFMHLGDEAKWTKWVILVPFIFFILYLIVMLVAGEGTYSQDNRLDGGSIKTHEQHAPAAPAKHEGGEKH
ncbi:MAG: cytochrome C oxidase subunit IV family protein [Bacteroidia bacterium]|jgi:caa(3)-type oxidase subunit IV|nr:cytochrome C oxidase subunit IV family protein [Bacteroidia bacterium]